MRCEGTAIYAGSFDPPTLGHVWAIGEGLRLFGRLTVVVGENPAKREMFSIDERVGMLREVTRDLGGVEVLSIERRFLHDLAREIGATVFLRGARNGPDFEDERSRRNFYGDVAPWISTILVIPPRELAEVSSTLVKSLIGREGWEQLVRRLIPPSVFPRIAEATHAGQC